VIVTIDGPAGAGKSTVARALADRLGYRYLDTGAMYRAVTLVAEEQQADPVAVARDGAWLERVADPLIRSEVVEANVSAVAGLSAVREALRAHQRAFLAEGDAVAEGRDIGAVVWPEAELKVWLDASPAERARRRAAERGAEAAAAALERDRRDREQTIVPEGSVRVDTEGLAIAEVVERVAALVEERR
jgi:cytidylate kinase